MRPNHPKCVASNLSRLWLFSDERVDQVSLLVAASRLPRGAGIVFRHYGLEPAARRRLFDRLRLIARRRGLTLLLAGTPRQAVAWGADGAHLRRPPPRAPGRLLLSGPVHDVYQLQAARRCDFVFLSPVFATRSHPGARPLGRSRFAALARLSPVPAVALGGMNARRFAGLRHAHGWAAIDALTPGVTT